MTTARPYYLPVADEEHLLLARHRDTAVEKEAVRLR